MTRVILGFLASVFFCSLTGESAQARGEPPTAQAVNEKAVRLPPFVVTELREGLPWQYAHVGNFEILSLCSSRLTQEFVEAQVRSRDFFPEMLQAEWTTPVQIVLFDRQTGGPGAADIIYYRSDSRYGGNVRLFDGAIDVADRDSLVIAANLEDLGQWDTASPNYAHNCLRALSPPAPTWLTEGLIGPCAVYNTTAGVSRNYPTFRIPALLWISEAETERVSRHTKYRPALLPLDELFADRFAEEPPESDTFRLGSSQSALFAYWALYGRQGNGAQRNDFWRFVAAARRQPVTEELFKQHFHIGYAAATDAMWGYVREAIRAPQLFREPKRFRPLPEIDGMKLRPATEAEVARIKGNWERMEANDLAATLPDLAAKYRDAAGRSLRRGYKLVGDRDPALLSVLGLYEYETGRLGDARVHLERAAASHQATTRSLLALARLRFDEERTRSKPDGRLDADQLGRVITPLFAARARSPAVADVYLQIAEAWAASEITPKPDHLAVLMEGTRLFPRDAALLYAVADLHLRHGYRSEAVTLAASGLRLAPTGPLHERFAALRARLADGAKSR